MSKATVMVHWPGQDVPACVAHAQKLQNVGQTMGVTVSVSQLNNVDVECTNCQNARKVEP